MVWHARETQSRTIVRLKSGDPAVFGRLGEELDALRRAGVEFEIVPGVTAASAAAASAKITLTDRRAASALVVVTAHNCRNASLSETVEPVRSTYALYMPGPDYSKTVQGLLKSGHEPKTPCAVVSNAGRKNEEVRYLTLHELKWANGIPAPAILIVGEVTAQNLPRRHEDLLSKISSEAEIPSTMKDSRFTQTRVNPATSDRAVAIGPLAATRDEKLPASDRRYQRYFITLLELIILAQKANVFIVYVNIQEATNVALIIAQVRLEIRKAGAQRIQ